ncbi:MAG: ABC transporter ATP-binding protein [Anaerolineae bacterium]|nr:ABC transporter ATP-binding protein [Anaerolineae bacterium]
MKPVHIRLLNLLLNYKGMLALAVLSAVINVVATLVGPLYIGRAIDVMIGPSQVDFTRLQPALLLLLIAYGGSSLFLWLLTYLSTRLSYKLVNRLRAQLYANINLLPLRFYDEVSHGNTINLFTNDADTVSDGILQGLMALISGVITIVGCLLFMVFLNPLMTGVVLLSTPVAYSVARFITTRSQKLFKETAQSLGKLNGFAEEMIEGQKIVQAFNYEPRSLQQFKDINAQLYQAGVRSQFISSLANPATRIVNNITYTMVGVIGAVVAIQGSLTAGEISSFLIYAVLFAKPINEFTSVLTQLQSAIASAERIFRVNDLEPEPPDAADARLLRDSTGAITFDHVSFAYDAAQPLIKDFNLSIAPGDHVAIVGHTGAGKTTLVNLLMRFYDIESGAISVDGTDIRRITRSSLRQSFGMVLQDTWLLNGSIRDNIAYAKPTATLDQVIAAATAAGAHNFICSLPNGYDTVITNMGDSLSQGQKQLLTISRVMLANPSILILDEATSSIDTYTEMHIQEAFRRMMVGRTSLVIAHRLSTIKSADIILVLDKGNIVEKGNHEELLNKDGYYAALYHSQFEGVAT